MSPSGLDQIARELAAGEISRRSALKRLIGAGLGLGAAVAPAGVAEAVGGGCPGGRVKCGSKCCPKNGKCKNGKCKCKSGFEKCGKKCVNLDTSVKHCGACGNACQEGETCVDGDCDPGLADCSGLDCGTAPNGDNCGICGVDETCVSNQCEEVPECAIDDDCPGDPENGCLRGVCNGGTCGLTAVNNGSPCDDESLCTSNESCQNGVCAQGNPVVCQQQDQCHDAGVCDPQTGVCSNPTKTDGAPCNDGNACTQSDTCQNGVCGGGFPVVCQPLDECHTAGICDPQTGMCSNPTKPQGTGCTYNGSPNGICNNQGICVECISNGNCPPPICKTSTCNPSGVCVYQNAPAFTDPNNDCTENPGTGQLGHCNGAGACATT